MNAATSKTMTKGTLLSGLFLSLALGVGVAHAAVKGSGTIKVHAKGPMGLKIEGNGPLSVSEDGGVIRATALMVKLRTGMTTRDSHMCERMHADKHPEMSFAVERAKLTFPPAGKEFKGKAVGTLKFHGVEKTGVPFTYTATHKGTSTGTPAVTSYEVTGALGLNVTHFGVKGDDLCQLGVCAKPDVRVDVEFTVTE